VIALALAAGPAAAQAPWFGVPTAGAGDGARPADLPDRHHDGLRARALRRTAEGRRHRRALTGAKMMADVKAIVGFSLERKARGRPAVGPDQRAGGREADRRVGGGAAEGCGPRRRRARESYPSENPLWLPKAWEVRLSTRRLARLVLQSAVPIRNADTSPKAAEAPLVFVGRGLARRTGQLDVRGKAAVINVVPDDSLFAAREKGVAREAGAARRGGGDQRRGEPRQPAVSTTTATAASARPASWSAATTARSSRA
jgi:hypothetical protein